ncbi:hypothetical protein RB196_19020 [Streptomyces sp. PmtA]|uniref:hypothetical protein n=1 Tax=Streptomyces sp. PmtA TaxID=3074275 RepID=UPI003014C157
MADPILPPGAAQAIAQAARMMQAAASPYVLVKHGRREDRAAVYDRFVQACARCGRAADGSGVEEVWATWQAINLRCRPAVREAADQLLHFTLAVADPDDSGNFAHDIVNVQFLQADLPWGEDYAELGPPMHRPTMGEAMLAGINTFTRVARADLNRHWWKAPVWGWRDLRAWRQQRAHKRQALQHHKELVRKMEAAAAQEEAAGAEKAGRTANDGHPV